MVRSWPLREAGLIGFLVAGGGGGQDNKTGKQNVTACDQRSSENGAATTEQQVTDCRLRCLAHPSRCHPKGRHQVAVHSRALGPVGRPVALLCGEP